jgi:hypothetical protein
MGTGSSKQNNSVPSTNTLSANVSKNVSANVSTNANANKNLNASKNGVSVAVGGRRKTPNGVKTRRNNKNTKNTRKH